jgi:hypothetical protein
LEPELGIKLSQKEFQRLCHTMYVEPKRRMEASSYKLPPEFYLRALDKDTKDILGYMWFAPDNHWYWFIPDIVDEAVESLFD